MPSPLGTLSFLMALAPWRLAYRVRAAQSGLKFFVRPRDAIGRHIAKYGTHEPLMMQWMADYLAAAPAGIMIDIGANVGWHALHAAQHKHIETVVAFEPHPFNAWLLDRNIAENALDKIIIDTRAVGARPGTARLFSYKASNFGRHSLAVDHGFGSRPVAVIDLDQALNALGFSDRRVALIKIDTEGYEPAVIAGASRTLTRTSALILEFSPDLSRAGGLSLDEMLKQLQAAGFSPFVLRREGGTSRINLEELRAIDGSTDVIFLRADEATPAVMGAMKERERGGLTLAEIIEHNSVVSRPVRPSTSP